MFSNIIAKKNIIIRDLSGEIIQEKDYKNISKLIYDEVIVYRVKINVMFMYFSVIYSDLSKLEIIPHNYTIYGIFDNLIRIEIVDYTNRFHFIDSIEYRDVFYYYLCNERIIVSVLINKYDQIIKLYKDDEEIMIKLITIIPDKINETMRNSNDEDYVINLKSKLIYQFILDSINTKIDILNIDYKNHNENVIRAIQIYKLNTAINNSIYVSFLENENDFHLISKAVRYNNNIYHILLNKYIDKIVTLEAVKLDYNIIKYIPENLLLENDIIMEAIQNNSNTLRFLGKDYIKDKKMILEIIENDGINLDFISDVFCSDKDVVLKAIKYKCMNYKYISNELKKDKEIILEINK
jgi:hypothetical protein